MSLHSFLFDSNFYSTLIILYLFCILDILLILILKRKRSQKKIKEAFEILNKGFANGTIEDTKDIQLIHKQCVANLSEGLTFAVFLEKYIIALQKSELEAARLNAIKNIIKKNIEEERCEKPFDGINDHERRLLSAIEDCAKRNETTSITHNLDELSIVLKNNQTRLHNAVITNRWTVPISIIGVILTIVIWIFGSTNVSQKDIEKISANTCSKIIEKQDSLKKFSDNKKTNISKSSDER